MKFTGIFPPVVTLFDESGNLDLELNRRYLDRLIDQGIHGVVLMGSSGEFFNLTFEERKLYMREMIKHINGRVPVIVGVGHTVVKEVLGLCNYAEDQGADGLLVVNPYYWTLSEDQLFRFYAMVAENTSLPILLYNIPGFTGQQITTELVKKLAAKYQNICGIKETISEMGPIREVISELKKVRDDFMVFSAFEDHLLPAQMAGAAGSINGTASFAPEISIWLYKAYQEKDFTTAEQYHKQVCELMNIYSANPAFFVAIREAVHQRWFETRSNHRAPFDVIPDDLPEKVAEVLKLINPKEGVNP